MQARVATAVDALGAFALDKPAGGGGVCGVVGQRGVRVTDSQQLTEATPDGSNTDSFSHSR